MTLQSVPQPVDVGSVHKEKEHTQSKQLLHNAVYYALLSKSYGNFQRLYKGSNPGGAKNCKNHKMSEFLSSGGANKVNLHDLGISRGGKCPSCPPSYTGAVNADNLIAELCRSIVYLCPYSL